MKLISVNVEVDRHIPKIKQMIQEVEPDVLCLLEATDSYVPYLESIGYTVISNPVTKYATDGEDMLELQIIASRLPLSNSQTLYYNQTTDELEYYDDDNKLATSWRAVLAADIDVAGECFKVATTHYPWTPHGPTPNEDQLQAWPKFIKLTETLGAHIMCGDFNIPRRLNPLYEEIIKYYVDTIPESYSSSMDKSLHRLGSETDKAAIFDSYMVDYVLTQTPYSATDVRLRFGVSDHAAVIATIKKH